MIADRLRELNATFAQVRNRKQMLRFHQVSTAYIAGMGMDLAEILDWVAGSHDDEALDNAARQLDEVARGSRPPLPRAWAAAGQGSEERYLMQMSELKAKLGQRLRDLARTIDGRSP
jgi:hypothetical protein